MLRALGHESDIYALTIDDVLQGDVLPFADPSAQTRRHHDLPLRAAVADDRGIRPPAARPRDAVPQRHAGVLLRSVRARPCSAWRRSRARNSRSLVGRVDLALGVSEFNRAELEAMGFAPTGVLPLAVDLSRITSRVRRPALEKILTNDDIDQLPVRRPHRAEQEDRRSPEAGGALQALRRCVLPLHLRRQARRGARVLRRDPGDDGAVPAARTSVSSSPVRCRTKISRSTTATPRSTSH